MNYLLLHLLSLHHDNIANQPAKTAYQNEIVSPVTTNTTDNATEYSAKIGLMYTSDYGFAAAPSAWTANLSAYSSVRNVNWMYLLATEWTISRFTDYSGVAFSVINNGYVGNSFTDRAYDVRPVFSLTSSVSYVSGNGSSVDPILVN